ncbi:hypothetical protein [Sphingomonas sp.]|uniref:hypothetical protein n=1 Tax=Sphingomonas sp. TaxID=28214 RepID=UPI002C6AA9DC|nr:hypothetical protein [Sphingomonas sp.]HWK36349.1 hypothetical protein [Sphingomonas sp.]
MSRAPLIMYGVGAVSLAAGVLVATRPAADAPAVYRNRIAAAMLGAFALFMAGFASAALLAGVA